MDETEGQLLAIALNRIDRLVAQTKNLVKVIQAQQNMLAAHNTALVALVESMPQVEHTVRRTDRLSQEVVTLTTALDIVLEAVQTLLPDEPAHDEDEQ